MQIPVYNLYMYREKSGLWTGLTGSIFAGRVHIPSRTTARFTKRFSHPPPQKNKMSTYSHLLTIRSPPPKTT